MKDKELIIYLNQQLDEYRKLCQGLEEVIEFNQRKIDKISFEIEGLMQKEDTGFILFSPIPVQSTYKDKIDQLKEKKEELELQTEKHRHDLSFYQEKVNEMELQLKEKESFEKTAKNIEEKRKQIRADLLKPEKKKNFIGNIGEETQSVGHYITKMFSEPAKTQPVEDNCEENNTKETDSQDLIIRLEKVKEYLYTDAEKSNSEIDEILKELQK